LRRILRTAFRFALAGPPVGLLIALGLLIAYKAWDPLDQSVHWEMVAAMLPVWLTYVPESLAAAYATGAPAAFAAGAVTQWLLEGGLGNGWTALASASVAAPTAALTVLLLDRVVILHAHLGEVPPLGQAAWLAMGALGAICAAIFTFATAAASPKPQEWERDR
jgi:hypothetical protein